MLNHLLSSLEASGAFGRVVVVAGPGMEALARAASPHPVVVQAERLGTGHAALQAAAFLEEAAAAGADAAVLCADNPLVSPATLRCLLAARRGDRGGAGAGAGGGGSAGVALLAMRPAEPGGYGRVVCDPATGEVLRVVEWADADAVERAVGLCNAGALCAPAGDLLRWLRDLRPDNARGEYYLTDAVALARAEGRGAVAVEAPEAELRGVNSRAELAQAEAAAQAALRAAALEGGATLVAPETVFFSWDTRLGRDVAVGPHVVFGPGVAVEEGAVVHAFSHLEGCAVRRGAVVGPFARLRPGTEVGPRARVGNFVEVKNAVLGEGAKAPHLSYLGDALVGAGANIGAGTVTCNYDGRAKHRTEIGAGAFIGSDTALVAPVRVGAGALVAAGSVVVEDVPDGALALARGRQVNKPGRGVQPGGARPEPGRGGGADGGAGEGSGA